MQRANAFATFPSPSTGSCEAAVIEMREICRAAEQKGALVTVFVSDDPAIRVGDRVALRDACLHASSSLPPAVRDAMAREASSALGAPAPRARCLTVNGAAVLVEVFEPPPHLF